MKKAHLILASAILMALAMVLPTHANNISVGTPTLTGQVPASDYTFVQFDLSWENSFRDDVNWDAAWVFVKYKETGSTDWNHAYLNTTAGNHTIPGGYECSVGVTEVSGTDRGMGLFIYRSSSGSGNTNLSDVQLRWEYGANGLSDDATVTVKVFGVEVVYVSQGNLNLNTLASANTDCEFTSAGITQITSEGALVLSPLNYDG